MIRWKSYRSARLAYFYMTGRWPETVDHINGVRDDDRYTNLRCATAQENGFNRRTIANRTGFRGVYHNDGKFVARIKCEGISRCGLGFHDDFAVVG
jgi:hypothetical protein